MCPYDPEVKAACAGSLCLQHLELEPERSRLSFQSLSIHGDFMNRYEKPQPLAHALLGSVCTPCACMDWNTSRPRRKSI